MNQGTLRLIIRLLIFTVKTGQWKNLLRALILVLKAKATWEEAMGRLDGSYYKKQVEMAADKYKKEHPEDFQCDTSKVPGYDRWKEAQKQSLL